MLTVFLPCRKGSQRIPDKNVREFAGFKGGLLEIKLQQLSSLKEVDHILVSSNDERILDFSTRFNDSRIRVEERPDNLGSSDTSTDELINHVPELISRGDVLWTHVTSPFITGKDYSLIINAYNEAKNDGYDSLMTVHKLQTFLWDDKGPVNYCQNEEKWPRTQTINPLYEVDSGVFLASIDSYIKYKDRIGEKVYLYEQDKSKSIDIDWPEDFVLAEKLWNYRTI